MKPLFIFEMANNHMGDVEHGISLIEAMRAASSELNEEYEFGFKLQYRDLDTFIHPSLRGRDDVPYVKRFEETRLTDEQLRSLVQAMRDNGFRTICTPFDEPSVDRIEAHGIETIKVASCSFNDWPLLERIALTDRPVIASTAAASLEDMDAVVSFFLHRGKDLTLMHCVAEYPAADDRLQINQIKLLKERYPECRVGYSTHESPDNTAAVMLAIAAGAEVFEKHVALPTDRYSVNAYSATPAQVTAWLSAARRAFEMCGPTRRYTPSAGERASLLSLRRGVFARRTLPVGTTLSTDDVVFAFPPREDQLTANDWSKYARFTTREPVAEGAPVPRLALDVVPLRAYVGDTVARVKQLLKLGNIVVPSKADLEISHHYGIERFAEYGLTLINVVNREYCKKLLVLLAGQTHPEQYHERKEETFVVLHGDLTLWLDGVERQAALGDVITVPRGVRHRFYSENGCVFEEISSTHYKDDSYYTDPAIGQNLNRKTLLTYWM